MRSSNPTVGSARHFHCRDFFRSDFKILLVDMVCVVL